MHREVIGSTRELRLGDGHRAVVRGWEVGRDQAPEAEPEVAGDDT